MIDRAGEHRPDFLLITDVCIDRDRLPAERFDPVRNIFGRLRIHDVVDDDVGAGCRKAEGYRAADPGVSTKPRLNL
jgi:hypothetical protein